jgi:maltose alpha-D-glucosyltransferase/alpha-amylase
LLDARDAVRAKIDAIAKCPPIGLKTRIHGDYHLGQVLVAQDDVIIVDFEGEPTRHLSERREKSSPLRDVAGMLRSFDYAARSAVLQTTARGLATGDALHQLESWTSVWLGWVSGAFVRAYLDAMRGSPVVPATRDELRSLLTIYLLEKAVYELGYELNSRPDWVGLPLEGIERLLG